jgi:cytochrome b561
MHWGMALLVLAQLAMGFIMTWDAPETHPLARLTTALKLYDVHKTLGVALLVLVALRLAWRIGRGTPPEEPTLATWQRETSSLVHGWLYFLMIVVPLTGWIGVSLFPALVVFDSFALPGLVAPDQPAAKPVFAAHAWAAIALAGLIALHAGAALWHHLVRRDGVLARMLPRLARRDH